MLEKWLTACLVTLVCPLATSTQISRAVPSAKYTPDKPAIAIVGGTLIDVRQYGRSTKDIADSVIVVRNGTIESVGAKDVPIPGDTLVINAKGKYVIPGLIDGFGALRTQGFADAYLYEDVTTVIVPTAPTGANVDGESAVVAPENGLSVLTGAPISGYSTTGEIPKRSPWIDHRLQDRRLESAELTAQVAAAAAAGRRFIAAGIDVWPDQLDVIVNEAHRRGLAVTAQLAFTNYPYAVNAGVDAFVRNDKYSLTLSRPQDFLSYADDPMGGGGSAAARAVCSPEMPHPTAFGNQLQASHTALMPTLSMEATADDVGGSNPWTLRAAAFVDPMIGAPTTEKRRYRPTA